MLGENVPVPEVVQIPEPVFEDPVRVGLATFGHSAKLFPAKTTGLEIKLTLMVFVTCKQFPFPVLLREIITFPELISAVLGTYATKAEVLFGTNVPDPELFQIPPCAFVIDPVNTTELVFTQTV